MKIEEIDGNFANNTIDGIDLTFVEMPQPPFELDGFPFYKENKAFCRLPVSFLPACSEGVQALAWHTAGGQLRFRTDSPVFAVRVKLLKIPAMSHMPATGSSGFDMYLGTGTSKCYWRTAIPDVRGDEYASIILDVRELSRPAADRLRFLPDSNLREITLNFPDYNGVKKLEIGLAPKSSVLPPARFSIEKPILFYGSSITQGGCCSRPGNNYIQHISRRLDAETINLGFSGNAIGEENMAELIASLELSAFVMDYDHNAPDPEHLERTHEKFFQIIRDRRPSLPVVFMSMPNTDFNPGFECTHDYASYAERRKNIIERTYLNALGKGDMNVYFIDGASLFGLKDRDACTVDSCHPNDLGFLRMADALEPVLRRALNI